MSTSSYEIANVQAQVIRAYPHSPDGPYAIPWYLVLGDPGSGRSTALHAMNLTWEGGDGPMQIGLPQQLCTYRRRRRCSSSPRPPSSARAGTPSCSSSSVASS